MEYRMLGRTGVPVSALCLGCMNFGRTTPEDESIRMIHYALDQGINFLDTANVYTSGVSETIVGKALQGGRRDKVVLATKVRGAMSDDVLDVGNNRRHIIQQCEASLKRLNTDWIDLYQIHRPQSDLAADETVRALDDLVRAGKVRYLGTSSWAAWQVLESLWIAKELGANRFVCEQPPYHMLDRSIERELIPMAQTYGIAIIPWSPLARGYLSGKYRSSADVTSESRFAFDRQRTDGNMAERWEAHFGERAGAMVELLKTLADEKRATMAQVAMAWVTRQPGVTSPIVGPRTTAHFEDNLASLDVTFSEDDYARIDALCPPEESIVSYYNGLAMDFGPGQYRW